MSKTKKLGIIQKPFVFKNLLRHSSKSKHGNYELIYTETNILMKPVLETRTKRDIKNQSALLREYPFNHWGSFALK